MPETPSFLVPLTSSRNYDEIVNRHAKRTGLDPNLIKAVIGQESTGNRTAVSPKGARGLMQLMPGTAKRYGVKDVNDPEQNIRGGTDYLKFLNNRYGGNVDKVLAGYNAGEGAVDKYNRIPPFAETRNYVRAVKARYQKLTGQPIQQKPSTPNYLVPLKTETASDPQAQPDQPDQSSYLVPLAETPQNQPRAKVRSPQVPQIDWNNPLAVKAYVESLAGRKVRKAVAAQRSQPDLSQAKVEGEVTPSEGTAAKGLLRGISEMSGSPLQLLPGNAETWVEELIAKGASGLMRQAAGAARIIPHDPFTKNQYTEALANKLNEGASQLAAGNEAIDREANRGVVSQGLQDVGGGAISSAPSLILMRLGVPAPVAFGLQSYLEAEGRDAEFKDILKETGLGAATGALFEIPLPAKQGILNSIGRRLAKAGLVGGGSEIMQKIVGKGSEQDAAVNALFGFIGGKGKSEVPRESIQTVPDALQGKLRGGEIDTTLAAREAAVKPTTHAVDVPAMRVTDTVAGAPPIELSQAKYPTTKYPESLGVVGPTKPIEGVEEGAKLNRWQHRDFGLVTETADQSGTAKGKVRVLAEDGTEHIIQRPKGTGAGNQIAVPVRARAIDARLQDQQAQAEEDAPFKVIDRRGQVPPEQSTETPQITAEPSVEAAQPVKAESTASPSENLLSDKDTLSVLGYSDEEIAAMKPDEQSSIVQAARAGRQSMIDRGEINPSSSTKGKAAEPLITKPREPTTAAKEPEIKTSKLALGVEAKAIEAKLTEGFQNLPEYSEIKVADQASKAAALLKADSEKAKNIALGKEMPPSDLLPESVFIAVENQALKNGDVDLLRDLASASTLPTEATGMGQRIRMLAERNPNSAVSAMREVQIARENRVNRQDRSMNKTKQKIKTEIQIEVKRSVPKAKDWSGFLDSIRC